MSAVSPPDDAGRTLRVLMYHKVNDLWPNPITVPTEVFAEQMSLLRELGTRSCRSTQCATTTLTERRFPPGGTHHIRRRLPRQPQERTPILSTTAIRQSSSSRSGSSTTRIRCRMRNLSTHLVSATRRSTGANSRSSKREASASSRTGSDTDSSPCSRPPRQSARSRSRSFVSSSGWGGRSRRSPSSKDRRPTIAWSTPASSSRPATRLPLAPSRGQTDLEATASSFVATTSSRIPHGPSSSSSAEPAT